MSEMWMSDEHTHIKVLRRRLVNAERDLAWLEANAGSRQADAHRGVLERIRVALAEHDAH